MRIDRTSRLALLLLTPMLVLVACGGGDDDADDTTTTGDDTTSSSSEGTEEGTVALDTTVYFAGFAITLEEAAVAPAGGGATVTVTGRAENLGGDSIIAPSDVAMINEDAGAQYNMGSETLAALPEVPGKGTGEVAYAYSAPADVALEDLSLRFGSAELAQATVPFDGVTDPVTLEPVEVDLSGPFDAGLLSFAMSSAELRYDRPDTHTAATAGKAFLHVTYDVTYTGDFAGGYPFATDETRLETASGLSLAPVEFPIELLHADSSITDQVAIWEVDTDDPGEWKFVGVYLPGDSDEARGELAFEMPEV